jgi:hypothetical protein
MTKGRTEVVHVQKFGYADIAKPKAARRVSFLPMMYEALN